MQIHWEEFGPEDLGYINELHLFTIGWRDDVIYVSTNLPGIDTLSAPTREDAKIKAQDMLYKFCKFIALANEIGTHLLMRGK